MRHRKNLYCKLCPCLIGDQVWRRLHDPHAPLYGLTILGPVAV
jgi:hypothetical protein